MEPRCGLTTNMQSRWKIKRVFGRFTLTSDSESMVDWYSHQMTSEKSSLTIIRRSWSTFHARSFLTRYALRVTVDCPFCSLTRLTIGAMIAFLIFIRVITLYMQLYTVFEARTAFCYHPVYSETAFGLLYPVSINIHNAAFQCRHSFIDSQSPKKMWIWQGITSLFFTHV